MAVFIDILLITYSPLNFAKLSCSNEVILTYSRVQINSQFWIGNIIYDNIAASTKYEYPQGFGKTYGY